MSRQQIVSQRRPAAVRLGRPPALSEEERRERILQAAEQVFVGTGYGTATMEEIARRAGMSKKTVYALYPDKRAVFAALVGAVVAAPLVDRPVERVRSRAQLRKELLALSELALGKRQVELTRLIIAEARQCPELAEEFHECVIAKTEHRLVQAVQSYTKQDDSAVRLVGAILGDLHLRTLLGIKPFSRSELEAHIDSALDLLLPPARR